MKIRLLPSVIAVVALAMFLAGAAYAADYNGKVEKAGDGKITVKNDQAKLETFEVDPTAKIMLDGKTAKLEDLKAGASVTVSTEVKGNKTVAVTITAKSAAKTGG